MNRLVIATEDTLKDARFITPIILSISIIEAFVSPLPYIEFMTTKRRRRSIKLLICPGCEEEGTLRRILYGMPDPETFDFERYAVGGCCFNGDGSDPDIACRECDWSGMRDALSGA
jgi:hypothetical protein